MKVKVLFGFLLSFLMLNGIESACDYFQELKPEETYYAYNPDFPYKSKGANQCTWQMTSRYDTKINCSVDIPAFVNCIQGNLSVQFTGGNIQKYCGSGTLVLEGINPIIKFDLPSSSEGGKFLCQIQENPFDENNNNNCKCGWKKNTRIVGGKETGINEYPMMSGLVDKAKKVIYCGSTIISEKFVLTAAHCVNITTYDNMLVVVGEHNVTTGKDTNATEMFRVSNCIIHPNYTEEGENDIAVCKINGTLKYSAEVGPVCLPFHHRQDTFENASVILMGWGLTTFGGLKSNTLQEVNVTVINSTQCKKYYPESTNNNTICTYSPGKDACQMDSGGPVLWQDPITHDLVLIGIISAGIGCGTEPAIATRTGAFIDWIMSVTPGVQYCMVE